MFPIRNTGSMVLNKQHTLHGCRSSVLPWGWLAEPPQAGMERPPFLESLLTPCTELASLPFQGLLEEIGHWLSSSSGPKGTTGWPTSCQGSLPSLLTGGDKGLCCQEAEAVSWAPGSCVLRVVALWRETVCVWTAPRHTLSWQPLSHQGSQWAVGTLPPPPGSSHAACLPLWRDGFCVCAQCEGPGKSPRGASVSTLSEWGLREGGGS